MSAHSILLAHADVHRDVRLDEKAPRSVTVIAGQPVRLRFSYKFVDAAEVEETWHFRFAYRIGDGEQVVKDAVHQDIAGTIDDTLANLHDDVTFSVGDHDVAFHIEADVHAISWDDGGTQDSVQRRVYEGVVRVHAR